MKCECAHRGVAIGNFNVLIVVLQVPEFGRLKPQSDPPPLPQCLHPCIGDLTIAGSVVHVYILYTNYVDLDMYVLYNSSVISFICSYGNYGAVCVW